MKKPKYDKMLAMYQPYYKEWFVTMIMVYNKLKENRKKKM